MLAISPEVARFLASSRASQQATPRESTAAPAMRAIVVSAGDRSDAASSTATGADGHTTSAIPTPASIRAVAMSRVFLMAVPDSRGGLSRLAPPRWDASRMMPGDARPRPGLRRGGAGCPSLQLDGHLVDLAREFVVTLLV